MRVLKLKNISLFVALLCLSACNPNKDSSEQVEENVITDDSPVLAVVNGESITQADVEFMIDRTFSGAEQLFFDEKMQSKILESLIASTAMRQKMIDSLPQDKLREIQRRAKFFEEELYVKEYLVQNATPEPVSSQMVQDYYREYPEEFGGGERKTFEMLKTVGVATDEKRDSFLSKVESYTSNPNWKQLAEAEDAGKAMGYFRSVSQSGLLDSKLENAIQTLTKGQVSDVVLIDGVPHLLRIIDVQSLPAQPLSAVSSEIRKKLAAIQLKKSVKKASEEAVAQSVVELKQ